MSAPHELYRLIQNDQPDAALALLASGRADLGYIDPSTGRTALILACEKEVNDVAMALIDTGESNPGAVDSDGLTALLYSIFHESASVALALIETGESNPGFVARSSSSSGLGPDPGTTALLTACHQKMAVVALALIRTDESRPEFVDAHGHTALLWAVKQDMPEVALALIATGNANPGHIFRGYTALIVACSNNRSEVALALIQTGRANPRHVSNNGNTALKYATQHNMTEVIEALHSATGGLETSGPDAVPGKKEERVLSMNINRLCFDVIAAAERPVHEFLRESPDHMVFMIVSKKSDGTLMSTDIAPLMGIPITRFSVDGKNLVFGCIAENTMNPKNIQRKPMYYDFKKVAGLGDLVKASQIQEMVDHSLIYSRLVAVVETGPYLLTTVGATALDPVRPSYVSARRCLPGQGGVVYTLSPCIPVCEPIATTDASPPVQKTAAAATTATTTVEADNHVTIQIGEKRVRIPTRRTMGDLKQMLANQQEVPVDTIRFLYKGHELSNDVSTSEIVAGDVVNAFIRKQTRGRGIKRGIKQSYTRRCLKDQKRMVSSLD